MRKSELHVTIVGSRSPYAVAPLLKAAHGMEFSVEPAGIYRLLMKGNRRSLIELVEVTGQDEYCARLERLLGLHPGSVPRLPSHVTLFTEPGGHGIGVYSTAEMNALSTLITDPAFRLHFPNLWA